MDQVNERKKEVIWNVLLAGASFVPVQVILLGYREPRDSLYTGLPNTCMPQWPFTLAFIVFALFSIFASLASGCCILCSNQCRRSRRRLRAQPLRI